jgi:phage shock protein E
MIRCKQMLIEANTDPTTEPAANAGRPTGLPWRLLGNYMLKNAARGSSIRDPRKSAILSPRAFNCLCLLLATMLLTGCSGNETAPEQAVTAGQERVKVQTVSPREAAALLEQRRDLLVLDLRTANELSEGSIERSMLTPFWSLVGGSMNLPQYQPVLLVCAVGGRSYAAGQLLVRNGFREVYNLRGGVVAWKHAGLPVKYYRVPRE